MEQDELVYSESARERVRKAGAVRLREFVGAIPSRRVNPWLLSLPQIPGFRRKGKQAADEQRRRLIQRLTTSGKQSERDWHLLRHLWLTWIDDQVRDAGLRQALEGEEHGPEAESGAPLVERVREELARIADGGTVSRETLETLISFGPFDEVATLYTATKAAPHDRDIERNKYLSALPEHLAEIDRRVKEALEMAQERHRSGSSDDALAIASQLNEVTQLLSSLSTQVGSLVQWQEAAAKMLEADSRRGAELESRLKVIEESLSPQVSSTETLSSATKIDELVDELLELLGRLEGLESQVATLGKPTDSLGRLDALEAQLAGLRKTAEAGESERRVNNRSTGSSGLLLRSHQPAADSGSFEITKPKDIAAHLAQQFNASGLLDRDASILACEVTGALFASQVISIKGSSSTEILRTLVDGLGGAWDVGSVPVGVFDDACLRRWKDGSDGRRLALENINSSAFEVYGTPVREAVVRAQLRRATGAFVVCGTLMDGHGGLPIIASYSELGPIINADSLVWRSNAKPDDGQVATVRVTVAKDTVPHEPGEHVTEQISEGLAAVGVAPSVVFSAVVRNAASVLAQLSKNEADVLEALLASWLFPYLVASGIAGGTIVERLSSTALGKFATSERLRKLVTLSARP